MSGPEVKITEEDKRIPFQIQTVQEHTLRAIRAITQQVNPNESRGKFAVVQEKFEKSVDTNS